MRIGIVCASGRVNRLRHPVYSDHKRRAWARERLKQRQLIGVAGWRRAAKDVHLTFDPQTPKMADIGQAKGRAFCPPQSLGADGRT